MKKEDGRKNNGGNKNAGRKSKSEEQNLVEKLSPMEDKALEALVDSLKKKEPWAVKLFMQYMYGMPKQTTDTNLTAEVIHNIVSLGAGTNPNEAT
tara:strand:+ start:53 stop:337 length:285 start_codon:yes stop_codon:yes gene_type:complete